MLRTAVLALSAVSRLVEAAAVATNVERQDAEPTTVDQVLLFQPPDNYTDPRTLYARTVELSGGKLLATWENYSPEPPPVWFPIYESTDFGQSWTEISRVQDQVYGFGLRYQPFLYELPQAFGDYPAGTVLLSGSAIPTNLSETNIELYASRDQGVTVRTHIRGNPKQSETRRFANILRSGSLCRTSLTEVLRCPTTARPQFGSPFFCT